MTHTDEERNHLRGSTALLAGRAIAILIGFLTQILTVRYLAKESYGALAYALSIVELGATCSLVGLHRATSRFLPIYEENRQWDRLFGGICVAATTIAGLGVAVVSLVIGTRATLLPSLVETPEARSLLVLLIALSPITAYDRLMVSLFAVFVGARAIFLRKHVLGPGLKLAAIVAVIAWQGGARELAVAHLAAGAAGIVLYASMLLRAFQRRGLLARLRDTRLRWPAKDFFSFSVPLLSSDVAQIVRGALVVIVLERLHSTSAVAEYRAVGPLARLNMMVQTSFSYLFIPAAARMLAHNDLASIAGLYRRTTTWIAILSFPFFAATFALAEPITLLLFSDRYASSATVLAFLALGQYINAALGFNAATLRVLGRVRIIVFSDLAAILVAVVAYPLLIPRFGAMGGAAATLAAVASRNAVNQIGLRRQIGVRLLSTELAQPAIGIALAVAATFSIHRLVAPPLAVEIALVAFLWAILLRVNRGHLRLLETLPELRRLPWLARFLGE